MKISQFIMTMVALVIAASASAGDLAVDNLTVASNAAVSGTFSIQGTVSSGTNSATATGGTIRTNGNYCIHTFTNVGTTNFVVSGGSLICDVLVVAGGGQGGWNMGGGGGAGGLIYSNSVSVSGTNTVTIGAGGTGGASANNVRGANGADSVFGTITATGGGGGNSAQCYTTNIGNGGSGGADTGNPDPSCPPPGTGISGQGHDGAYGGLSGVTYLGGGGGGAAQTGANGGDATDGGGAGADADESGTAGTANTGGGGGGSADGHTGAAGGSGIVIVRYAAGSSSSNVTTLSISSNGISQTSTSGVNVLLGKVGIGTNSPAEQLHVVGNARVDGTNIVSAITLGGETRTTWPNVAVGALIASNNLSDITNPAAARTNLGLGTAATNDASTFDPAGSAGTVSSTLSAHTANLNNPHQVTAAQVGALTPTGDGSQLTGITAGQMMGALVASNNLSDVANQATARANLGLGTAATNDTGAFLSTTGGVVNGSLDVQYIPPKGDLVMGSYTNQ